MTKPELSSNGAKLIQFLDEKMHDGAFTNNDLVQFIEAAGRYLNLQTIPDYRKQHQMSYNGVKNFRNVTVIFNTKYVIDND